MSNSLQINISSCSCQPRRFTDQIQPNVAVIFTIVSGASLHIISFVWLVSRASYVWSIDFFKYDSIYDEIPGSIWIKHIALLNSLARSKCKRIWKKHMHRHSNHEIFVWNVQVVIDFGNMNASNESHLLFLYKRHVDSLCSKAARLNHSIDLLFLSAVLTILEWTCLWKIHVQTV